MFICPKMFLLFWPVSSTWPIWLRQPLWLHELCVCELLILNLNWLLIHKWLMLAICYYAYKLLKIVKLPFADDKTDY